MTRPSEPHDHATGLTYAPDYDKETELDSREIEPVMIPSADLSKLEYVQQQTARRTLISRAILLTIIFGMLAGNAWLTQRNYTALLINVNHARLEQSQALDDTTTQLADVTAQLIAVQRDLDLLRAQVGGVAAPTEPMVAAADEPVLATP